MLVFYSCAEKENELPITGSWHATMETMDDHHLPFNFELSKEADKYQITVHNAEEEVLIEDIEFKGDSIYIRMPVFEGYFKGVYDSYNIIGDYVKEPLNRVVPFSAKYGKANRFPISNSAAADVSGIWEVDFSGGTEDFYKSKGIFNQDGNKLTGTFRTNTGDYRFLEGVVDGDSLKLSCFDGAHAFLFLGKVTDSTMNGVFYSGNHFKEPFEGHPNEEFELADSEELTFLKEGYKTIEFSFPDSSGKMVSLSDPDFENKVVGGTDNGNLVPQLHG